jgi:hypothetical protein
MKRTEKVKERVQEKVQKNKERVREKRIIASESREREELEQTQATDLPLFFF